MIEKNTAFKLTSILPFAEPIDVIFIGIQETGFDELPDFPLYNLTSHIPGHPPHSTVSREELESAGYLFPFGAP